MITSVIFIASLLLLLLYFKSRRSRIAIGLFYGLFTAWYVYAVLNYSKYTLQPGQSVKLKVFSKTEQLEYNSELILEKKDDAKVKLSGRKGWGMKGSNTVYNVEKQSITEIVISKDGTERRDLPNDKSKSIYLESDGIVVQGEIKEIFGVTEETSYTITITNVDNKPAKFEAQVVDR